MLALLNKRSTTDYRNAIVYDGHISYGQSWRSNDFPSFGAFGLNNNGPTALMVSSVGVSGGFLPGPLSNSAGISTTGTIIGITNYAASDTFAIGRCAVLAQQLLRVRDGETALQPVVECCAAWPGSTWTTGRGGGLAPGGTVTGSVSGTVLTVTSAPSTITLAAGQVLVGAGINALTTIQSFGTAAGGAGTYNTGLNVTILSAAFTGTSPAASFTAQVVFGIMTVSAVATGTLALNQVISHPLLPVGTIINALGTGTGGVGTYYLGLPQTAASTSIQCLGQSWNNMTTVLTQAQAAMPYHHAAGIVWSSVGYTQGSSSNADSTSQKQADLDDMIRHFDLLGPPMVFYFGLPAPTSGAVSIPSYALGEWATYLYCRVNAVGQGGTYSGRVFPTGPSYPWQFSDDTEAYFGNIHTDPYGTSRWGEIEGYARWLWQDKGIAWTPLWRPLTGGAITRSGQVLTVPMARPSAPDFAAGVMSFQSSNADDGLKVWPQYGWHVYRAGVELPVTPSISGMNVLLTVGPTINPGDALEVSYAWYGPGGPTPGVMTGVGGNLVMQGPPSVLYPNGWNGVAKTIDAWAWPFAETVTA
jgi:hypothetical protein